ncbi:MAG: hypothetical protein SFY32_13720 [Bacteroidota bacterium]|nr:hypothetical protein [Bacteroidota bacterium]
MLTFLLSLWDRFIFFLFKRIIRKHVLQPQLKELEQLKFQQGQTYFNLLEINKVYEKWTPDFGLEQFEYKVFSQWGQDGIIQFLIYYFNVNDKLFIEFGSSHYLEANTRFLLMRNNWKGLIIDGSSKNINSIKSDEIYWRYNLTAVESFITRDNINQLIENNGFTGNIGLLSIDIDGNDYHVWEAISVVNPAIVIIEYNTAVGADKAITIPYQPDFERFKAHYSGLYFGASLCALEILGNKKGYRFIYCNENGNDAFFVREDIVKDKGVEIKSIFKNSNFRMSKDKNGNLNYLTSNQAFELIRHLPFIEI